MRQLIAFANAAKRRRITESYYDWNFHAKLQGAEMASLDSVLGVDLGNTEFTPEVDKALENQAQKLLREKKAMANV